MINKEPILAWRLVRCPLTEYHIVHSLPAVLPRSILLLGPLTFSLVSTSGGSQMKVLVLAA